MSQVPRGYKGVRRTGTWMGREGEGGPGRQDVRVALSRFQIMKFLKTLSLKLRRNTESSAFICQTGSDKT